MASAEALAAPVDVAAAPVGSPAGRTSTREKRPPRKLSPEAERILAQASRWAKTFPIRLRGGVGDDGDDEDHEDDDGAGGGGAAAPRGGVRAPAGSVDLLADVDPGATDPTFYDSYEKDSIVAIMN